MVGQVRPAARLQGAGGGGQAVVQAVQVLQEAGQCRTGARQQRLLIAQPPGSRTGLVSRLVSRVSNERNMQCWLVSMNRQMWWGQTITSWDTELGLHCTMHSVYGTSGIDR